jgi:hypothetical protein
MTTNIKVHNESVANELHVTLLYPSEQGEITHIIKPDEIKSYTLYPGLTIKLSESK